MPNYSNSKVIANVGYISEAGSTDHTVVYLASIAVDGVNNYFLTVPRDAFTKDGVNYPKGWVFLDKAYANGTSSTGQVVLISGVKQLISQTLINQDVSGAWAQVKAEYLTNGNALLALPNKIAPGPNNDYATMPVNLERRGEGITEAQVEELIGINNDILPNGTTNTTTGTGTGLTVTPTTTKRLTDMSLEKDPVGGVTTFFKQPIEYTKANPFSGGAIIVGLYDVAANVSGKFRPIVFGKHSLIFGKKVKHKRA